MSGTNNLDHILDRTVVLILSDNGPITSKGKIQKMEEAIDLLKRELHVITKRLNTVRD